ncbi:helix-turn-helix domain-containing protein [Paenibacillus sp. N3.4]|uniref:helix-turn-helix domain-containing protein n=1 Tax=Paenibacillus sp. N3.4 TaxID=2603222 RepID=UPI0011CA27AA|nr:helix-turn-helix domain-containing protein [Paenibacillus sp. N3.4]TXK81454.1 helix-turn-helix domain-containing protein [Paenibacillus sp. N3.4]
MFREVAFKRRSIIFTWLLSYIAILLVPVLMSIVIYTQTNQTITEEINRSNSLILSKVQIDMDNQLQDIKRLSVEIGYNPQVQELLSIREPLKPEQYFSIYKVFENLKVFQASSRSNHFLVYFRSIDTVITPDISNTSEVIFNNLYAGHNVSYTEWIEGLNHYYNGEYVVLGDELAYIRSLPIGRNGISLGSVVIFLDQNKFWVQGGENYIHSGTAAILDKNDRIVASSEPVTGPMPVSYSELHEKSGVVTAKWNDQDVVISYISSGATDWKYMIMMPQHVFWDKSEYIKKATAISLLACLIVGGGLSYAFVRKNYSPVRAMMELFKEQKEAIGEEREPLNEYDFMRQAIRSTLMENTDMSSRLWRQKSFMRGHFIEKLLKGRASAIPLEQSLESYGARFVSDAFAVMILNVEEDQDMSYPLIRFAIMNVTEEWAGQIHQGFMTEIDDLLVCLINLTSPETEEWKRDLSKIATEVESFMDMYYHVAVSIAISSPHYASIGISKAYDEALEAMEYQDIYGVKGIMHYSDMDIPRTKEEYYYPLEKEQALMNYIKTGDYESAEKIVDEIFKDNLEQRKLPLKIAKCLFVDLVSTMLKTINEIGSIYDNSFLEELSPIEQLLNCHTVSEMKQQLKDILQSFCSYIGQEQGSRRTTEVLQCIMEMVHNQYRDLNLSIAFIAEQIGLHPAYVSKLFKERNGVSLLDYIGKIRIEKAKEMMKGPNITMENIALSVGYSNVRTFRRAFAKYEGITPGKYSDLIE